MAGDISLRCACGTLRGAALDLTPSAGTRIICYCNDCQAFARFLGRAGITDRWGGTDVFQMAPSRLRITSGKNVLRCVRLSAKGMHRWYCGECRTPVGNTMGPRVPFVGLIHAFLADPAAGRSHDDVLGKPLAHIWAKSAIGGGPPYAGGFASQLRVIGRTVRLLATWWATGAGSPSAFFDEKTRGPAADVRVLTADERRALSVEECGDDEHRNQRTAASNQG